MVSQSGFSRTRACRHLYHSPRWVIASALAKWRSRKRLGCCWPTLPENSREPTGTQPSQGVLSRGLGLRCCDAGTSGAAFSNVYHCRPPIDSTRAGPHFLGLSIALGQSAGGMVALAGRCQVRYIMAVLVSADR